MFDDARNEDVFALDAVFSQDVIEKSACSSDKRSAGFVFLFAWVLSDEHQPCVLGAFSRNRVFGAFP